MRITLRTAPALYICCSSLRILPSITKQGIHKCYLPLFFIFSFRFQLLSSDLLSGIILYGDHGNINLTVSTTFLVTLTCHWVLHRWHCWNNLSSGYIRAGSSLQVHKNCEGLQFSDSFGVFLCQFPKVIWLLGFSN